MCGPVAQSTSIPIAEPGVVNLIPNGSHTFGEIGHGIFSVVILLLLLIHVGLLSVTKESMCT